MQTNLRTLDRRALNAVVTELERVTVADMLEDWSETTTRPHGHVATQS